uniref:Uncharacterized protein n=1 Tax=Panagrolaimus sp. JU765 TaxID=591449 RepID=A0AC34QHR3_9BILA
MPVIKLKMLQIELEKKFIKGLKKPNQKLTKPRKKRKKLLNKVKEFFQRLVMPSVMLPLQSAMQLAESSTKIFVFEPNLSQMHIIFVR